MRQYEPVWVELKKKSTVRLAVPKALHRRIIKAVLKEKYMDFGYRLEQLNKNVRLRLEYSCKDNIITFTLKKSFTFLSNIKVEDL